MTVAQLIALLKTLPPEQQQWSVGCTYDCDFGWTEVDGIHGEHCWTDKDGDHKYIRLQGG